MSSFFTRAAIALALTRGALASIAGPVIQNFNFPDPSIINFGGLWYAFGTGTTVNIPYATSSDFVTWTLQTTNGAPNNALPTLPAWAVSNDPTTVWAPDVNQLADGSFIMYFAAATVANTAQHCIGAAKSASITGPYVPTSDTPLFCPSAQGGAIDASGFLDSSGARYIVYKVDGNSIGHGGDCGNDVAPFVATPIILQPVTADGITLNGDAYQIMNNNGSMDTGITEAPSIAQVTGGYVLFFSTGCYSTPEYTVSYATATSLTGPYTRQGNLLVTGDDSLSAPGSLDVTADGSRVLFHGNAQNNRELYTGLLTFNGLTPVI